MPRLRLALAVLTGALLSAALWYGAGRAQEVDGALGPAERLQCVSYTPLQGEETPADFAVSRARLARDFTLLAPVTKCIRIYSVKGMELVPVLAREHGLEVIAGAWVSRDVDDSEREIRGLIQLAQRYPDVIRAVLVGNEVLLRRERSADELARLLRRVKDAVPQPVSYGDVWEFWLHAPALAAEADFLTIHLLPYWENDPTGIDAAVEAVAEAHAAVARAFPGKPLLVGETGWPSAGRWREDARTGRITAARFVRGFVARAREEGWRYNLIEAFDQPWKRAQEGAVGGYWGLFDAERVDKNILRGRVSDLPAWRECLLLSLLLWVVLSLGSRAVSPGAWLLMALAASGVVHHLHRMTLYARGPVEEAWYLTLGGASVWAVWAWSRGWRVACDPAFCAVLALAAVEMLGLAFDPRYRDFPVAVFAAPALAVALGGVEREPWGSRCAVLGGLLLLCVPAVAWQESLTNPAAMAWIAVCTGMAFGVLRGRFNVAVFAAGDQPPRSAR